MKHIRRKFFKSELIELGSYNHECIFFFLISTEGGNLFKWKSGRKDLSQRGYYPLDCKAMGSFLLHLQNNRCKDSNVWGAEHKGYSVTGS